MSPWVSDLFLGSQSDERLVSLARAGHDRAFVAIAARYKRQLVGFARRLGAESNAEDVVQQALMSALTALRAGAEVQHVRGWLHEIVRNAALKAAGRAPIENELTEDLIAAENLEEEVERRMLVRTTLAAIAVLPDSQRDAFVKTAVQGRSRSEVALSMGLSEGAVRQLVHRARASLRTGATAVMPYPIAVWAAGPRPAPGASRVAEIIFGAGAGAGSAGGLALKTGAVVVATGVLATTLVVSHARPAFSHRTHRAAVELRAPGARAQRAGVSAVRSARPSASSRHALHAIAYVAARSPGNAAAGLIRVRVPHGRAQPPRKLGLGGTSGGEGNGDGSRLERPVRPEGSGSAQDSGDEPIGAPSGGDGGATASTSDSSDGASAGDPGTSTASDGTSGGDAGATTMPATDGALAPTAPTVGQTTTTAISGD